MKRLVGGFCGPSSVLTGPYMPCHHHKKCPRPERHPRGMRDVQNAHGGRAAPLSRLSNRRCTAADFVPVLGADAAVKPCNKALVVRKRKERRRGWMDDICLLPLSSAALFSSLELKRTKHHEKRS